MHTEHIPVQIWSPSDLRSLKWGSILFGIGLGVFLPRGLRRYGRWLALGTFVLALKPLMAMLREDTVVCSDRPLESDGFGSSPTDLDGAEFANGREVG